MHRFIGESDLFPEAAAAGDAIAVVREAVVDIYRHVGRPVPPWIHDNDSRGWNEVPQFGTPTIARLQADPSGSASVRIMIVRDGNEYMAEVLPPNTDPEPYVQDLVRRASVFAPFAEIRIYVGQALSKIVETRMRGAT